jgi:tetratricopeptide (TPR) repeat protein
MWKEIEAQIAKEDWEAARQLILAELALKPQDPHWLLTRLGLTYYEERNYMRALEYAEQAYQLASNCPLVQWDYAGTLEMLDRTQEALTIYSHVLERDIESLAFDQCGEGLARARGLYADCLYRMSHCFVTLGHKATALDMLQRHLKQRGPGCHSIYSIKDVRRELTALQI